MTISIIKGAHGAKGAKYYVQSIDGEEYYSKAIKMENYYIPDTDINSLQLEPIGKWYAKSGVIEGVNNNEAVDKKLFHNLCAGRDINGVPLINPRAVDDKHIALYDVTFSAPKSFSVLWSILLKESPELAQKMEQIHEQAVKKALDFINEQFVIARYGKAGINKANVDGVFALWPHCSSRAHDPQYHMHCTLMNLAWCEENGKFNTLELTDIYRNQLSIAAIYHNELAAQLIDQLGVSTVMREEANVFEIAGIPELLMQLQSKRSAEIDAAAPENASPALLQKIALETRSGKDEKTRAEYQELWHNERLNNGYETQQIINETMIDAVRTPITNITELSAKAADILTASRSLFSEAEIFGTCSVLTQGRLNAEELRGAVEAMKSTELVYLGEQNNKKYYSTQAMIALESEMIELSKTINPAHELPTDLVQKSLKEHGADLSDEQINAVLHATQSCETVSIIEGAAGAGKSKTLGCIKKAYEAAGYKIEGLALSWSAAGVMSEEAAIKDARAIEGFCRDLDSSKIKLNDKTVVVIDEAGLVGSRHMHKILSAVTAAGAKLLPTGDSRQLLPVAAGGALSAIVEEIGSARIDTVRRQGGHVRHDLEAYASYQPQRDAVLAISNRDANALELYESMGRLTLSDDRDSMLQRLIADWSAERRLGRSQLIIANDNSTVREINEQIRTILKKEGKIAAEDITLQTTDLRKTFKNEFAVGDEIMFRKNDRDLEISGDGDAKSGVNNRSRGVIKNIEMRSGAPWITVKLERGGEVEIKAAKGGYWDDKKDACPIQHAYATTIYASQGMTVHDTYLVDSTSLNWRLAYVGISRHMSGLKIYADKQQLHENEMARVGADEYRHINTYTRPEFISMMKKNWEREAEKTTTVQFLSAQRKQEIDRTRAVDVHHAVVDQRINAAAARAPIVDLTALTAMKNELAKTRTTIQPALESIKKTGEIMRNTDARRAHFERVKTELAAAKQIDLPFFLQSHGYKLERDTASSYKYRARENEPPYLIFKSRGGDWLAYKTAGANDPEAAEKTLDAVGLVQEIMGTKTLTETLEMMRQTSLEPPRPLVQPARPRGPVAIIPATKESSRAALEYATTERGISAEMLLAARKQGFCRADDRGVVFIGYDEKGAPRCAETRTLKAVEIKPGSWTNKVSVAGTDKTYAPILRGENPAEVHIVEGGFDALALHDIYKRHGKPTPTVICSMGGKITKFLDSPVVQSALKNATAVSIWRENEKNNAVQQKMDKQHQKQLDAVNAFLSENNSSCPAATLRITPSHAKDLAEANKLEAAQRAARTASAVQSRELETEEEERSRGLSR